MTAFLAVHNSKPLACVKDMKHIKNAECGGRQLLSILGSISLDESEQLPLGELLLCSNCDTDSHNTTDVECSVALTYSASAACMASSSSPKSSNSCTRDKSPMNCNDERE